jgi:BirA family biotin operon repressor/biotin-[acetyl-CoA-carboxylase] ligase
MNFTVLRFDSIGSTNTEALAEARLGAPEGLTVVAREQTAGRGRHGRAWNSAAGSGLYASIVLRPRTDPAKTPLLTLMTAVAVSDLLRTHFGLAPDIKWVNDVLVGGKKICGILAEVAESDLGRAVIVGIGINLRNDGIPPELAGRATSIESETGVAPTADQTLDALLGFFGYFYDRFNDDPARIIEEWAARSTYHSGKRVRVRTGGDMVTGTTSGLEDNGALRVRTDEGTLRAIQAGEVELLRPDEK